MDARSLLQSHGGSAICIPICFNWTERVARWTYYVLLTAALTERFDTLQTKIKLLHETKRALERDGCKGMFLVGGVSGLSLLPDVDAHPGMRGVCLLTSLKQGYNLHCLLMKDQLVTCIHVPASPVADSLV